MAHEISRRTMLGAAATAAATVVAGAEWRYALTDSGSIVRAAVDENAEAWKPEFLSKKEAEQLAAVCEAIIPQTDTAGARAARVHEFIDLTLSIEGAARKRSFTEGLKTLDKHCKNITGQNLSKASEDQIAEAIEPISDLHDTHPANLNQAAAFFRDVKNRTIFAYYTSEEGRVEELGGGSEIGMEIFQGCQHPGHEH